MSVKELKFEWPQYDCEVEIDEIRGAIRFLVHQHDAASAFELDRSQACLLMLYIQERLAAPPSKER